MRAPGIVRLLIASLLGMAACETTPGMPWLRGLDDAKTATGSDPRVPADLEVAPDCGVAASRTIELRDGRETIAASYSGGITIFDHEDRVVVEARGRACAGSADELQALSVGTAWGERMIAMATTSGGRRETETTVALYTMRLEPLFTGVVETRMNDKVARGAIQLLPRGVLYKSPRGEPTLVAYDAPERISQR